ncbi:MAG: hypothetical protein ACKO2Z_25050, partial [Sphaerospermopsis kisseleviana]
MTVFCPEFFSNVDTTASLTREVDIFLGELRFLLERTTVDALFDLEFVCIFFDRILDPPRPQGGVKFRLNQELFVATSDL